MQRILTILGAITLSAGGVSCAWAQQDQAIAPGETSPFVGSYVDNEFGEARLDLKGDGTFGWSWTLDGGTELTASGVWEQSGETIAFRSVPVPVPSEMRWAGMEQTGGPMLRVFDADGEVIRGASVFTDCADGQTFLGPVGPNGSSPDPEQCPDPVSVRVMAPDYDVEWPVFDLAENGWKPGMTIRFEFYPNDHNVIDFAGSSATLEGDTLTIAWPYDDETSIYNRRHSED